MGVFRVRIPVRFQHVDPAGLVFYPRYFEMLNQVVEDWFAEGLGLDFRTLHRERRCGVPTVHVEADFTQPSRLGDELTFTLRVAKIGRSAFTLDVAAFCGEEERLRSRMVLVYARLDQVGAMEIPAELRAAMQRFVGPE